MTTRILITLSLFFAVFISSAQRCYETVKKECSPEPKTGYIVSGQSKNGTFAPADTAIVELKFYANMDYRLSFCSSDPNIQGNVQFQVVEYKTIPEYQEIITYEEVYPEEEEEDYDDYEEDYDEDYDDYDDYDDYEEEEYDEEEEEEEEVEPQKVPVITKKRIYKKIPVTIYDNQAEGEGGAQTFYHISRERKTVYVKVYIPGNQENSNKSKSGRTVSYACVGLLLEHQPAPKLGFK